MPVSRRRRGRAATRAARSGNLAPTTRRKKTNKLYLAASVVIAVLVIASFAFASFSGGGGSSQTGDASGYVQGVGVQVDIEGNRNHLDEGETIDYTTAHLLQETTGGSQPRAGFTLTPYPTSV